MHVDDKYRITIFLDTNILIDILDKTFKNLNYSINYLAACDFVNLKSSHYVMFEMIENRKWKYFLEEASQQIKNVNGISKYKWNIKGIKYINNKNNIQTKIQQEKEQLLNDFTISWEENVLHDELLLPTLDLCLESTISREDSLVLLTAVFPKSQQRENHILLMSRDKDFDKSYNEIDIKEIFKKHHLNPPEMIKTTCLSCSNRSQINLNNGQHSEHDIQVFWKQKIKETVIHKNKDAFLGYTYSYNHSYGAKCVFFNLQKGAELNNNTGLTIIGKDLDFFYNTHLISEFWNNQKIKHFPFVDTSKSTPISFKLYDKDEDKNIIEFRDLPLLSKMKEKGNLIFINEEA